MQSIPEVRQLTGNGTRNWGDRAFRSVALACGLAVFVILGLIAFTSTNKAWPAFSHEGLGFVTTNRWVPNENHFGALALIYGTAMSAVLALLLSVPVSFGIALFVTEFASPKVAKLVTSLIDLLAAVPSVVYGLWATLALAPNVQGLYKALSSATASIPVLNSLFGGQSQGYSLMTASIVLAIMITPIITSLSREALATVPESDKAGALALGATQWEAIRVAVFPKARGGLTAAVLLGLGRAMGETIAVAMVIGSSAQITLHIFSPAATMAGTVASQWGEASGIHQAALVGLGVVLFIFTIAINSSARFIVARSDRKLAS